MLYRGGGHKFASAYDGYFGGLYAFVHVSHSGTHSTSQIETFSLFVFFYLSFVLQTVPMYEFVMKVTFFCLLSWIGALQHPFCVESCVAAFRSGFELGLSRREPEDYRFEW